ncbi:MAG: hypothetical protein WBG90_03110, partial [Saonia sp.]
VDLRKTGQIRNTYLTSHVFPENIKIGWATASNPDEKLMVGYAWETEEYPWLNIWHQFKEDKVKGRAIEFATCGLGLSFEDLITEDYSYFGNLSLEFIDARQTITKTYYMFVMEIPDDFLETTGLVFNEDRIIVTYLTEEGGVEKTFLKSD